MNSSSSPMKPVADHHQHLQPPPTWLELLPDPLKEQILERLPVSDYARFAAACSESQSIQQSHRRRFFPLPPPNLPLPWLVPSTLQREDSSVAVCYSPFERRFYRLEISDPQFETQSHFVMSSSRGWLLVFSSSPCTSAFYLFNPISKNQVKIPRLRITGSDLDYYRGFAAISAPPPESSILVATRDACLFLFRINQPHWCWNSLPLPANCPAVVISATPVFSKAKFYCLVSGKNLLAVDPVATPAVEYLEMDGGILDESAGCSRCFVVECNGDLLLVVKGSKKPDFKLFKADFARNAWVNMESIGDTVLLLSCDLAWSLVAANVGMQGNCILYTGEEEDSPSLWKVYDLEKGVAENVPAPEVPYRNMLWKHSLRWFFPTIC